MAWDKRDIHRPWRLPWRPWNNERTYEAWAQSHRPALLKEAMRIVRDPLEAIRCVGRALDKVSSRSDRWWRGKDDAWPGWRPYLISLVRKECRIQRASKLLDEGLTWPEVAADLGVTVKTIQGLSYRSGMPSLRRLQKKRIETHTEAGNPPRVFTARRPALPRKSQYDVVSYALDLLGESRTRRNGPGRRPKRDGEVVGDLLLEFSEHWGRLQSEDLRRAPGESPEEFVARTARLIQDLHLDSWHSIETYRVPGEPKLTSSGKINLSAWRLRSRPLSDDDTMSIATRALGKRKVSKNALIYGLLAHWHRLTPDQVRGIIGRVEADSPALVLRPR